jgi:hypothetical protein
MDPDSRPAGNQTVIGPVIREMGEFDGEVERTLERVETAALERLRYGVRLARAGDGVRRFGPLRVPDCVLRRQTARRHVGQLLRASRFELPVCYTLRGCRPRGPSRAARLKIGNAPGTRTTRL